MASKISRRRHLVPVSLMMTMMMVMVPMASGSMLASVNHMKGDLETSSITSGAAKEPQARNGVRALPSLTNVSVGVGLGGEGGAFFSWGDYNNDGNPDLLVNGRKLFENGGPPDHNFNDVTSAKGLATAGGKGTWGDYDNDGDLDLYVANWDDKLFQNQGPPTYDFVDVTVAAGNVKDGFPGTAASWGDFDRDGDLDLYVVNGEVWDTYTHYPDTLWRNEGNGSFTNVTVTAGVDTSDSPHYGRGATWGDLDNDGWQDLYISNYRLQYNYLWYNNRNGTFTDRGRELGAAGFARDNSGDPGGNYYGHTIGSSLADLNNDGLLDVFVSNLVHKDPNRGRYCDDSNVYVNNGYPYWNFTDIRKTSGIPLKPVGGTTHGYYNDENFANAAIADFDNDGYMDVYIPQVYKFSWMYSYLYRNQGNSTWTNVSDDLGLHDIVDTYGGAWADYDNDGDMDLVTGGRENRWNRTEVDNPRRIHLFRNDGGNDNNWLKVNLTGVESNRDGVGAKVYVHIDGEEGVRMQQVETGMGSHGQQNDMRLNFGLGSAATVDTLEVRWPSGIVQRIMDVAANQEIDIIENVTGPRITSITGPQTVTPDTEVTVGAETTGDVALFEWDLEGDGDYDDYSGGTNQQQTFTARGTWTYMPTLRITDTSGLLGHMMTTKVHVVNVAPEASLTGNVQASEDEVVVLDASGSSDTLWDSANLTYQYFFGDGTNTSPVEEDVMEHTYPIAGTYEVTVRVTDHFEATDTDNLTVEILNPSPTVTMEGNTSVPEDVEVFFNATGNDTVSDLASGLEYSWNMGDGTVSDWSFESGISHVFTESGLHNVSVRVRDDDMARGNDTMTVSVENLAPVVTLDTTSYTIDEDNVASFSGQVSDTPSDEEAGLEYMWDFGDGNRTDWGTALEVSHTYTRSGDFTARLIARDVDWTTANATASVKVMNVPPVAQISEAPVELVEDEEGYFLGLGIDTASDTGTLEFRWDLGDGTVTEWRTDASTSYVYTDGGDYRAVLEVRDDDGSTSSQEVYLTVVNLAPTAEILSPERSTFEEDQNITFLGNGSDTASDQRDLNFTWKVDGEEHDGTGLEWSFDDRGTYEVIFSVSDEATETSESMTIRIENVPPSVEIEVDRTTVDVGGTITLTSDALDTGSDMDELVYEWDCGPGNEGQGLSGPEATCTFLTDGIHLVKLKVTDDDGASVTESVGITVQGDVDDGDGGDDGPGNMWLYAGAGIGIAVVVVFLILYLFMGLGRGGGGWGKRIPEGTEPGDEELKEEPEEITEEE